ncbi:MAG: hypothetical protein GX593_09680 [Actinomycetales bacterium]|nr:hypothetical protein [Actinomycetales bacterium]
MAMLAIAFVCVVVPVSDSGGVRDAWSPFGRYMVFFWAVWALVTAVISSRITIRTVRGSEHFSTAYQQSALQVWFTSTRFEEVASRIREWSLARPEELRRSEGSPARERDRDTTVVLRKLVWLGWPLGLAVSQLIAVGVWLASPWLYTVVLGAP